MKLSEYLKDKVYFIIVNLMCISIIILLLLAFKVRFSLIMAVTFLLITENILLLMIDYFRKKNFYTSLIQKLEELDKKYVDFINFLKQKDVWEEDELKNYCRQNKLMLNNAISIINDYYDDNYDNYLIEEDNNLFYVHNF